MSYQSPLVSVIIPTYNRSEMLKRAIQSVLLQTYQNFEIIVVDDGSTDNTQDVLGSIEYRFIKYIRNKANKGGAYSRNLGIDHSKGRYIAFLDSDDEWLPTKLEKQIILFENSPKKTGVVYCSVYDKGHVIKKNTIPTKRGNLYRELLLGWCPPTTSSFVVRAEALKNKIQFDENLASFQDYDLWLQLSLDWDFDFVPESLVIFHHHERLRVSKNLQPRINSLRYFLNKWHSDIVKAGGTDAIDYVEKKYLYALYSYAALNSLRKHERTIGLRYFYKILILKKIRLDFLVKFLILFVGNQPLLCATRKVRRRFEKDENNCLN
jgi:glycosyltransferase involved in cell wall biosynthesis